MTSALPESVHDREELERLLREDAALHAYELGDLDDFFWRHTTWYRLGSSIAMLYYGTGQPLLLALDHPDRTAPLAELLDGLSPLLPQRFCAHVSAGAEHALAKHFQLDRGGLHYMMTLTDRAALAAFPDGGEGEVLAPADLSDLTDLYLRGYPQNGFDPRLIDTGHYVGLRRAGRLVAVAGVHVWSPRRRVCTLGNITTDPDLRGQGLGTAVVAAVCRRVLPAVDVISLNVKADNVSAVALYRRLGFSPIAEFHQLWARALVGGESGQAL